MALSYFTFIHILISLAGIAAGFGVLAGLIAGKLFQRWTAIFLATTVATSVTGFFFPFHGMTPALLVGVLSTLVLVAAGYALYFRRLDKVWCKVFVITVVVSLYLNFFVLVVQLFQKMPAMAEIAPEQTSPPFVITQTVVLAVFVLLGYLAVKRFRTWTW